MALKVAEIEYEHREVSLKDKPAHMLEISPKGTVPVLQLADGTVLEESLDIMYWALEKTQSDMIPESEKMRLETESLIARNDQEFKQALDRYKYPERFGETTGEAWRQQGEEFFSKLEHQLMQHRFLFWDCC